MSHEYGRSSVWVRSWMSKLYDLVNWRLQNLQMNCFLGREARPGVAVATDADEDRPFELPGPLARIRRRSNGAENTGENVS